MVPVPELVQHGLSDMYDYSQSFDSPVTTKDLERASRVASLFRHEVNRISGPDLWLTTFMAELSRLKRPARRAHHTAQTAWSVKETQAILNFLSENDRIDDAVLCNIGPLVNSSIYTTGLPQLECMVHLLASVEGEIRKRRLDWAYQPGRVIDPVALTSSQYGKRKILAEHHSPLQSRKWVNKTRKPLTLGSGTAPSTGGKSGGRSSSRKPCLPVPSGTIVCSFDTDGLEKEGVRVRVIMETGDRRHFRLS